MAVAPIQSVERVLEYAITEIPPEKILMGLPSYGYNWTLPYKKGESKAQSVSGITAVELASQYGAEIYFDIEKSLVSISVLLFCTLYRVRFSRACLGIIFTQNYYNTITKKMSTKKETREPAPCLPLVIDLTTQKIVQKRQGANPCPTM